MTHFIEVTDRDGYRMVLNVAEIAAVKTDDRAFKAGIVMRDGSRYNVQETVADVKNRIDRSQVDMK